MISGTPKEYVRTAASGGKVRSYFCPECGSTVYWKADNLPAMIGVAVGAIADPDYPAPVFLPACGTPILAPEKDRGMARCGAASRRENGSAGS